jgi:CBS domain-containing protein
VLSSESTVEELRKTLIRQTSPRGQHLYPVVDADKQIKGVITRKDLRKLTEPLVSDRSLGDLLRVPVVAFPDEPLRVVVLRMAETGFTRLPVIDRTKKQLAGMVSLRDLLMARVRNLNEERQRERVLQLRLPFGNHADVRAS